MSLSRKVAQELCTATEMKLFEESTPQGIKQLTDKQIESKIKVARKNKEKYTDLYRTQIRKAQSGKGRDASSSVSLNTAKKAKLFDDCLRRFEAAMKKRIEEAKNPKRPVGRPPGSLNKKTIAKKTGKTAQKKASAKKKRRTK